MLSPLTCVDKYVGWSGEAAQTRLQELIGITSTVEKQHAVDTFYASRDINIGDRNET
jgi:hypothetical protein